MTDTIRELINRILDYVERTPGTFFEVHNFIFTNENRMIFYFYYYDKDGELRLIPRYGYEYWSQGEDLTEDNLRYLLEQLEKFEQLEGDKNEML